MRETPKKKIRQRTYKGGETEKEGERDIPMVSSVVGLTMGIRFFNTGSFHSPSMNSIRLGTEIAIFSCSQLARLRHWLALPKATEIFLLLLLLSSSSRKRTGDGDLEEERDESPISALIRLRHCNVQSPHREWAIKSIY